MKIIPIPCLNDNYAYLIICPETQKAGVVDPAEAGPVLKEIRKQKVLLTAILNTHHHWDHVSGNEELLRKIPGLSIYGHVSDKDRIPKQNVFLVEGDKISIGNLEGTFTHSPGHTSGSVIYYFGDAAFTGDTLFSSGCGRLFEGSPEEMFHSLHDIASKPPATKIYFGHEYTELNLKFALSIEPHNQDLRDKAASVKRTRAAGAFSTPSPLENEMRTNPFLRWNIQEIQESVKRHEPLNELTPVAVFRVIRQLKDQF
ncbi:hydroxyacylglutathione hydrolase [Deltaproteobacteria bacterium TL4]